MSLCWSLTGLATELPEQTEYLQKMGALEVGKAVPWFAAYDVWGERALLLEIPKTVVFDKKGILQDILGKEGRLRHWGRDARPGHRGGESHDP